MSNTLNGAGARFLAALDFNAAIAACTTVIENNTPTADDYLCRGYAHCFVPEKDGGNFDKAIADCSTALHLNNLTGGNNAATAYRVRAYANYLKGDYANALADCNSVIEPPATPPFAPPIHIHPEDSAFVRELRARINLDSERCVESIQDCAAILYQPVSIFPNTALAETYRQACKKMENR